MSAEIDFAAASKGELAEFNANADVTGIAGGLASSNLGAGKPQRLSRASFVGATVDSPRALADFHIVDFTAIMLANR